MLVPFTGRLLADTGQVLGEIVGAIIMHGTGRSRRWRGYLRVERGKLLEMPDGLILEVGRARREITITNVTSGTFVIHFQGHGKPPVK